ncbi:MAG: TonB C-terminal domain-containing protein [Desulfotalea sp.]
MFANHREINQINESWTISFIVVFILHIGLALAVTFTPDFTKKKPRFENIYTVDLIQIAAPSSPPQPVQKAPVKIKPEAVSTNTQPDSPVAPISIKPRKKKVKIKKTEKIKDKKPKKNRAAKQKERLEKALKEEQEAKELAAEAQRLLDEERRLLNETTSTANNNSRKPNTNRGSSSSRNSGALSAIESQWLARVNSHLLAHWALPSVKDWDPFLKAIIVVELNNKGTVLNTFFERKSGDRVFDQFVKKSLQEASPLPAMPAAMKKTRYELGLNYTPSSIQ